MKTRYIYCNNRGFFLGEEQMPKIEDDQTLVKTVRSLISVGTETTTQRTLKADSKDSGLGYANVGRVVEIGKKVTRYKAGDIILTYANHRDYFIIDPAENPAHPWPMTHPDLKIITKVPPDVANEEAAFTVIGNVALYLVQKAEITIGQTVVVIGLGTVGQLACQFARLAGAVTIVGIDVDASRFALAKELGVDQALTPSQKDALKEILAKRIAGSAPPVFIEATGSSGAFRWAVACADIAPRATIVVGGFYTDEVAVSVDAIQHEMKIIGAIAPVLPDEPVYPLPYNRRFNWNYILHQIARKKLTVRQLADGLVTPEEAVAFYNAVREKKAHLKQPLIAWE